MQSAYADSFGHVFLIAAFVAVLTLMAVLVARGAPLRTTVALRPGGGDGAGSVQPQQPLSPAVQEAEEAEMFTGALSGGSSPRE